MTPEDQKELAERLGLPWGHIWKYVTFSTHHGWEPAEYYCDRCNARFKDKEGIAYFPHSPELDAFPLKKKYYIIEDQEGPCPKDADFSDPRVVLREMVKRNDYLSFLDSCLPYWTNSREVVTAWWADYIIEPYKLAKAALEWLREDDK